jgi:hypothetical protein
VKVIKLGAMSALEPVVREHERMSKKQTLCREQTIKELDKMITAVQATATELRNRGMCISRKLGSLAAHCS